MTAGMILLRVVESDSMLVVAGRDASSSLGRCLSLPLMTCWWRDS